MTSAAPTAEQAIQLARWIEARGWKPTPLHTTGPDGRTCSCSKGANCGKSAGKHNIAKSWQTDLRGREIFEEMSTRRKRMNAGILTGAPSGIVVLDIDVHSGGMESMRAIIVEHGQLPDTFIVQTGTGGYHYYFQMPDFDVRNSASKIAAGIDIRGTGGMVVAPYSVSYAGPYVVRRDVQPAPMPKWLYDLLRARFEETQQRQMPTVVEPAMTASQGAIVGDFTDVFAGEGAGESLAHVGAAASVPSAPSPSPAVPPVQTAQQAAYEASILSGELGRVEALAAAGWKQPWDITTFEVACQLIELANAPWTKLTLPQAQARFLASCPPPEPGYDPLAKWLSAEQRVGNKARPAPVDRQRDDPFEDNPDVTGGLPPDPTRGGGADREGAPTAEGPFALNDLGNADRLIRWHGDVIRYAADAESWLVYEGGVWSDSAGDVHVEAMAKSALALAATHEAALHSDVATEFTAKGDPKPTARDRFYEWTLGHSGMYAKVVAMQKMARSDMRVRTALGLFDADPMLFNAANCAIDLRTGEAIPHAPALMFRHQSPTAYNPGATAPLWQAFLARTQPDPEMRAYLQMVLGYSMTGRMDEQAIFIHNGPGATGKTTFLEAVKAIMGGYGQKVHGETLMSKGSQSAGHPADVARMAGARFLAASETATGRKLDDERVKELVGGDTQSARHLYGQWFDFQPTGKIHMATNHLPGFESGGDGMGRRLRLVPWEVQIPEPERDKTLKDRIVTHEAEGVLAWLVEGAVAWTRQGGLRTPQIVVERSREHIEEADPVWPFIEERLELGSAYETEFQAIVGAYESWCSLNGNKPMSGRALSMALRERLGADAWFKHSTTRRSMFKVRVRMQAVPAHHDQFFTEAR